MQLNVACSRAISDGGHCARQQSQTVVDPCNHFVHSAREIHCESYLHHSIHTFTIHPSNNACSIHLAGMATIATLASSVAAADALIGARVVNSTQKGYRSCIRQIEHYFITQLHHSSFTVPVILNDILSFFGWLVDSKFKAKPAASSTIRSYKSALKWWYKEQKVIMEQSVDQGIETLLQGYQRRVADWKAEGKMAVFEGKLHLTYDGYCLLSTALFEAEPFSQMLFGWPFIVLQWNLIARSATVAGMMMEHVGWEADSLLISTPKHKGDQEGAKCFARHLYANPLQPTICPVLALAVLIFTRVAKHDPSHTTASAALPNYRIFNGANNESRFSEVLGRIIAAVPDTHLSQLGSDKKQLGTHSVRKGAASYCAGMVNGPSTVQVFLRAGWSLGNVQDRYLFAGAGGDQLTGRVLCGLPFNDAAFATLPPHFDADGLADINWPAVMPLYSQLPDTFKRAMPYLLASVCYHEQWLRSALPAHHPLFHSYLFASGEVKTLKAHVVTGRSRCPLTGMQATGIPPHLVLSNELNDVAKQTQVLKDALLAKCTELPAELVSVMLARFSINGAIPVTIDDIKTLLNNAVNQMRAELRDAIPPTATAASLPSPNQLLDIDADPRFQLWTWKGRMHMVPEGWLFPSTDVKTTWNLWHYGHMEARIRPLRHLKKVDLQGSAQITLWSKTNGVMAAVAVMMVEMKAVEAVADVTRLSAEQSSAVFDAAIVQLMERVRVGSTRGRGRWMEMSIGTLYNHLQTVRRERKRKRDEQHQQQEEQKAEE